MASKKKEKLRVIVTDPIDPQAISRLKKHGFKVDEKMSLSREALLATIPDYHILVCRTNTKINKDFIDSATNLRCIGLASTGHDQIDTHSASERGIHIFGLPSHNEKIDTAMHGNFISTAEHTMLMILAALGDFNKASNSLKEGRWDKHKYLGGEAYQKTLGIIGLGRIGKLVAARAQAFGMNIIAYDPYVSKESMGLMGVKKVSLAQLCRSADIITIHAPKTPETISLLDSDMFKLMKRGVILVNAARSEIVDRKALIHALKTRRVHRFAVDVFQDEPHGIEWDVVRMENVIPTPHIAGSTEEALRRISLGVVESIIRFFRHEDTSNLINHTLRKKT